MIANDQIISDEPESDALLVSDPLTRSEIDLLRQSKKEITDFVQMELPMRLKERQMDYMLYHKSHNQLCITL